ncbi:MAG TPA: TonB-dependent receptor, partial [Opitutaceae bacterium]|nr:TonB-dependent receptor [Opitutaceae bacterium]
ANVTPGIQDYIDARRPIWESIIDTRTGLPWFTTRYGSQGTAIDFLNGSVLAPYKLLTATEGKSRPQIRRWRANVLGNVRLEEVPIVRENKWLRRLSLSGAVRWEDKASIGYYTFANDPNAYDPSRIIYDESRTYFDFGASYSGVKFWRDRITMRMQLNVRNAFEGGRLQAVGALPNGVPHSFRIVDPRLWILSASFDL